MNLGFVTISAADLNKSITKIEYFCPYKWK